MAKTVFMLNCSAEHDADNLHVAMGMRAKAPSCCDIIVITDAHNAEAHVLFIKIIAE
ncbi:hypothetical protein D3C71_2179560 [compost metagenome]